MSRPWGTIVCFQLTITLDSPQKILERSSMGKTSNTSKGQIRSSSKELGQVTLSFENIIITTLKRSLLMMSPPSYQICLTFTYLLHLVLSSPSMVDIESRFRPNLLMSKFKYFQLYQRTNACVAKM